MDEIVEVRVPGGVVSDGDRLTTAGLRRLNGHDQEALLGLTGASSAQAARLLLDRCLRTIGGRTAHAGTVSEQTIGDREALLWHLRSISFGDRIAAVVECAQCHEKLDVDLSVADLLQPAYPRWTGTFTENVAGHRVRFRLPTVADQDAAGGVARTDGETAAELLLRRCVLAVDDHAATDDELALVRTVIDDRIAALDPQAEALLDIRCPQCDASTPHVLDAGQFLMEELARTGRYLYSEVHTLAWYYHWSEGAILDLPVDRRRRYLDLIADTVGAST
ncbi:T4 family baseplate hub assembly chaperone [Geodermatophilus sp. URMC 60]